MKPRFRESAEPTVTSEYTQVRSKISTGEVYQEIDVSFTSRSRNRRMDGFDIPNYTSRKRSNELLPITPFTYSEYGVEFSGGSRLMETSSTNNRIVDSDLNVESYDSWFIPEESEIIASLPTQEEIEYLLNKAASKIYSQGHDSLTFIAELHKVVSMFTGLRERLIKLLMNPKFIVHNASKAWLEYRYGWRTLFYDLIAISDAIDNLQSTRSRFSEKAGKDLSRTSVTSYKRIHSGGKFNTFWQRQETIEGSARANVIADIHPPSFRFSAVNTAWELIPFSFIVDWFMDVGAYLEAQSTLALSTAHVASLGFELKTTRTTTCIKAESHGTSGSPSKISVEGGAQYMRIDRQRWPASASIPPKISIDLDIPKLIDLWALMITRK